MMSHRHLGRLILSATVITTTDKMTSTKCNPVCKPSELPIYIKDDCAVTGMCETCEVKPTPVEDAIGSVRRSVWAAMDTANMYQTMLEDYINDSSDYAKSMYKYLSEESDDTTRMGAVGVGAATGFILGLRGGILRKLVYSGIGAYVMCAVCYPKETAEYSRSALANTRKYTNVAYNFAYGVKKDDVQLSLPALPELPKLPSTLGEAWDMANDLGKSASNMISGAFGSGTETEVPSPQQIVQQSHDNAEKKACHCPVGACLGRHEEK